MARVRRSRRENGRVMRAVDRVSVPRAGRLRDVARMGAAYNAEEMVTMKLTTI